MIKKNVEIGKNMPNNQTPVNDITTISWNNTKNNNKKKIKTISKSIMDIEWKSIPANEDPHQ